MTLITSLMLELFQDSRPVLDELSKADSGSLVSIERSHVGPQYFERNRSCFVAHGDIKPHRMARAAYAEPLFRFAVEHAARAGPALEVSRLHLTERFLHMPQRDPPCWSFGWVIHHLRGLGQPLAELFVLDALLP